MEVGGEVPVEEEVPVEVEVAAHPTPLAEFGAEPRVLVAEA